jgi:uncharacterized protein (DUF362 family)
VKIENDKTDYAVEKAIDLLGGIQTVTKGKNSIMLKPNLVAESPTYTTKPSVIRALAKLMQSAGKEVLIGEGSAAADGFNFKDEITYRTRKQDILDSMQKYVFDQLGYSDLAQSLKIPLLNLHSGDLIDVELANGLVSNNITLHKSLMDVDMLCSVPMMKTHVLATVTLGMKNLIGLYPGTVYYSVRSWLHDRAAEKKSPGIAFEIIDMVRANKLGLVVVDASMAMEGDGPSGGSLVKMDLIIAGTNPLATDMVSANIMGFEPAEVPTFLWAIKSGMTPSTLNEIEIRGEAIENVKRKFVKPNVVPWTDVNKLWGVREI